MAAGFDGAIGKDNEDPGFASQGQILLDIFVGDCDEEFFNGLDDFLNHGKRTYYFQRKRDTRDDGEEGDGYVF